MNEEQMDEEYQKSIDRIYGLIQKEVDRLNELKMNVSQIDALADIYCTTCTHEAIFHWKPGCEFEDAVKRASNMLYAKAFRAILSYFDHIEETGESEEINDVFNRVVMEMQKQKSKD